MTAEIIKLPYVVTRKLHARKPRKSKNGTPEERAAKARKVDAEPVAGIIPGGADVIAFRQRETAPTAIDETAPAAHEFSPRTLYSDAYFRLPFVTPPDREVVDWKDFWEATSMWNDAASAGSFKDGKQYARDALAAIRDADSCTRQLEITVERMIESAFQRRDAKGRPCRGLSSSERGFLGELCSAAVRDPDKSPPAA